MLVKVLVVSVRWKSRMRAAPKNHSLSFLMGPPSVNSYVGTILSVRAGAAPTGGWSPEKGVSAVHLSLSTVMRAEPLTALPPDFVSALTTPPWKRPYSAD